MMDYDKLGGPLALKALRTHYAELNEENKKYQEAIAMLQSKLNEVTFDSQNLKNDLVVKVDAIAKLKQKEMKDEIIQRSIQETEHILIEATSKSSKLYNQNQEFLKEQLKFKAEIEKLNRNLKEAMESKDKTETSLNESNVKISEMTSEHTRLNFRIDETLFEFAKIRKRNDVLEKEMKVISDENEYLSATSKTLKAENDLLTGKIREMIDENKDLTESFTQLKEAYEASSKKYEQIKTEYEESQILCNTALKQKKETLVKLDAANSKIKTMDEKIKKLEASLLKKDAEIEHLIEKVNQTIAEYSEKLEKKEQMLTDLSAQMAEDTRKQKVALAQVRIDPDFIKNLEKKYEAREVVLQNEIKSLKALVDDKETKIESMQYLIDDLQKKSYKPRMEKLMAIERGIRDRLEEMAITEEKIEVRLTCPHDVKVVQDPYTLLPCAHTFCNQCLEQVRSKQKHASLLNCPSCKKNITDSFRNVQLGLLVEDFQKRRELGRKLSEWFNTLNRNKELDH